MIVLLLSPHSCVNLVRSRRHFHALLSGPSSSCNMMAAKRYRLSRNEKHFFCPQIEILSTFFFFFLQELWAIREENVEKAIKPLSSRESLLTVLDTKYIFVLHKWVANNICILIQERLFLLMCKHLSTAFPNCMIWTQLHWFWNSKNFLLQSWPVTNLSRENY